MNRLVALSLITLALLATGTALADGGGYLGLSVDYNDVPAQGEGRMTIATVYPSSPAAHAGLEIGDVVTRINGAAFGFADWTATVEKGGPFSQTKAGDRVGLTLSRAGRTFVVELLAVVPPPAIAEERRRQREKLLPQIGVKVLDRLSEESALVRVEKLPPEGHLRASAVGLEEKDAAALSHLLATSRLRVLFAGLEPGGSLQLQLGMRPDTGEPSIEVVRP